MAILKNQNHRQLIEAMNELIEAVGANKASVDVRLDGLAVRVKSLERVSASLHNLEAHKGEVRKVLRDIQNESSNLNRRHIIEGTNNSVHELSKDLNELSDRVDKEFGASSTFSDLLLERVLGLEQPRPIRQRLIDSALRTVRRATDAVVKRLEVAR